MLDATTTVETEAPGQTAPEEPKLRTPPRGRGRPRKDEGIPGATDEKTPPGASAGATEGAKKRKAKTGTAEVEKLAQFLAAAHFMLSNAMKAPELMLTEPDAMNLSGALIGLAEQYSYEVDPKMAAIGTLVAVSFSIYAPRLAAVGARAAAARAARPKPAPKPPQQAVSGADQPGARPVAPDAPPAPKAEEGPRPVPSANGQPEMFGAPEAAEIDGVDTLS